MAELITLTANWTTGKVSSGMISRQYDNNRYCIKFTGIPDDGGENLIYYLLIYMKTEEGAAPVILAPVQLASDEWIISNYFTQIVQQVKFQLCVQNEAGTFEAHSPIFDGSIRDSLDHDGEDIDIDTSELFDYYRAYVEERVNELIVASGDVQIDTSLSVAGAAAEAKAVGDALSSTNERLAQQEANSAGIKNALDATMSNDLCQLSSGAWELGSIDTQTGINVANNARLRTSGYIDISACSEINFTITTGYKYWWYLYDAEGTLLRQRQVWATSDTEINSVIIGSAVQMRIVMSNTNDTAASIDYAQYLTITGVSKLKAIVDGTAETANSIDHTMGVDIEETVSDVQQHFYYAPFKQGDTMRVSVTWEFTGSGDKNVNIKDDTGAIIKVIYSQGIYKFDLPRDTQYIIVTLAKVSTVTAFTATYSIKSGMVLDLDNMLSDYRHTFSVEKGGTGDFTRLTDAIREACQYMDSVVYVGDGTWDLIAELGAELDDISSSNWGLYLSNRVHIIFSSNSKVTANYTGSNTNVLKYFSPFNTGKYGFTLENATIEASRCRYCVHDERGEETDHYESHYINCNMLMDNSNNEAWSTAQCIGGGLGRSAYIDIDRCVFDSNMWGGIVSYHNCAYANSKSNVNVHNSYFKRHGTFRLCWYGVSTEITTAYVSGCSFASAIVHRAENESATVENTAVVEWNNEVRTA
jgi:hypothetical protein